MPAELEYPIIWTRSPVSREQNLFERRQSDTAPAFKGGSSRVDNSNSWTKQDEQ